MRTPPGSCTFRRALVLTAVGVLVIPALGAVFPNVWVRMAASGLILAPLACVFVDVAWRDLFVPSWRRVAQGVVAAAALYAASVGVCALLATLPGFQEQVATVYAWKRVAPRPLLLPLLLVIVTGEEIVWRCAVTLPLAARWGPWRGAIASGAAFAAAHFSLGVPILMLAALGAGTFWSAMVVRSRSAVPALVCHVLWDLAVLFVRPLGLS